MRKFLRTVGGVIALAAAFAGFIFVLCSGLAGSNPRWYELFEKILSPLPMPIYVTVLIGAILCEIWFAFLIIGSILVKLGIWKSKS